MLESEPNKARFRGAFLGCALGDAIGRPFEMMSVDDGRLARGVERLLRASTPLSYSDDTEMAISVAESLVALGRASRDHMLTTLARNCDLARGYGHGTRRTFEAHLRGENEAARSTWAEGSKGSGGAVRVVALACAHHDDLAHVADLADETAALTHAHPSARAAAVTHALVLGSVLQSGVADVAAMAMAAEHPLVSTTPLAERMVAVRELLASSVDARAAVRTLGNGVVAEESVPLALFCFFRWAPDFEAVVTSAVLCGGDTDTVAAMSGALCGALVGETALPSAWLDRLENGPKGADHLRALADATFDLWRARR